METASRVVTEDAHNVFPFGLVFDDQMFGLSIVASGRLEEDRECQECYKNSALFAQFLLTFLTYVLLSYFVHLHCTHTPTPLPFFLIFTTFRTSRQGIQIYSVLKNTY